MKKRRVVHQWRDWLLEQIADDEYKLIQKNTQSVHTIVAHNTMEAENQCRQIIRDFKVEGDANPSSLRSKTEQI
jgi:chemotaxis regulatin CheY-phosphate phosphatase CheZ